MNGIESALKGLQNLLRQHFGNEHSGGTSGAQIYIHRNSIEMTRPDCHIVARGPVQVATVLRRKRRK